MSIETRKIPTGASIEMSLILSIGVKKEKLLKTVSSDGLLLRHYPAFQGNKQIVLAAISHIGLARLFVAPSLEKDPEIVQKGQEAMDKFKATHQRKKQPTLSLSVPRQRQHQFLVITDLEFYKKLKDIADLAVQIRYNKVANANSSCFLRDSHVCLIGGGHLIPHPIKDPLHRRYFHALLADSSSHFLKEWEGKNLKFPLNSCGPGVDEENVDQAILDAEDLGIPYRLGTTCIEGGNCFVFLSDGVPKAIVGELSLYLSLMVLEEQGFFKDLEDIEPTSEKTYRTARNVLLYKRYQKPLNAVPKNEDLLKQIKDIYLSPLSQGEEIIYHAYAHRVEAKIAFTKARIAEELGVALENCAFIPQRNFHIDMELFVTPEGSVVIHNDKQALTFLEVMEKEEELTDADRSVLEDYKVTAQESLEQLGEIQEQTVKILKRANIPVRTFPAIFYSKKYKSALNYCNGIFLKKEKEGFIYSTTGPSSSTERKVTNFFKKLFGRAFPGITLHPIPEMSSFVMEYDGGIHCLTFEAS